MACDKNKLLHPKHLGIAPRHQVSFGPSMAESVCYGPYGTHPMAANSLFP